MIKLKPSSSIFHEVSIKVLLGEIVVLTAGLAFAGYMLNPEDPFLVNERITYLMVLLTVLTLYYGLGAGLTALFISTLLILYFYETFPTDYFLWHALLTLIMGEFNFYWRRHMERATLKSSYMEDKLDDMARNFILLKESHNQLERAYLVKPVSIRSILYDVREAIARAEKEEAYRILMSLLSTNFNLSKGAIYRKDDGAFTPVASAGEDVRLDVKDPLVRRAIEEERVCYVSMLDFEREVSQYLAVVPIIDGEPRLLMLIKEMPFVSLNKDNLFLFYVLLHHLYEEEKVLEEIAPLVERFRDISIDFLKEVRTHYELRRTLDVESTLVALHVKKSALDVEEIIKDNLRTLDVICKVDRDDQEMFLILLPFAGMEDAKGFYKRLRRTLINYMGIEIFSDNVNHRFFHLTEEPCVLLEEMLSLDV